MTPRVRRWVATVPLLALGVQFACNPGPPQRLSAGERRAIADSLRTLVVSTYDLQKPGAVQRMMSLYPAEGPVYSTSSGQMSTTRAALERQIQTFWQFVGSNMRDPKWNWTSIRTDVLAPDAAVMSTTYRIDHLNPHGMPHSIAGAWMAVFARRDGKWVVLHEHLSDVPVTPHPQ